MAIRLSRSDAATECVVRKLHEKSGTSGATPLFQRRPRRGDTLSAPVVFRYRSLWFLFFCCFFFLSAFFFSRKPVLSPAVAAGMCVCLCVFCYYYFFLVERHGVRCFAPEHARTHAYGGWAPVTGSGRTRRLLKSAKAEYRLRSGELEAAAAWPMTATIACRLTVSPNASIRPMKTGHFFPFPHVRVECNFHAKSEPRARHHVQHVNTTHNMHTHTHTQIHTLAHTSRRIRFHSRPSRPSCLFRFHLPSSCVVNLFCDL